MEKVNYAIEVTWVGSPRKIVLHGQATQFAMNAGSLITIKNMLVEAGHRKHMLVHLQAEQEYSNDAIRAFLGSMGTEEAGRFISENQIAPPPRRKVGGYRGPKKPYKGR